MKFTKKRLQPNTIRFKIAAGVITVLFPAVLLLCYNFFYAANTIKNQVAESNKDFISLYINQIDTGLNDIDKYLGNLIATNMDLQTIDANKDENQVNLALKSLSDTFNKDVTTFKSGIQLFLYSEKHDYLVFSTNGSYSWRDKSVIQSEINNVVGNKLSTYDLYKRGWIVTKGDSKYTLARILKSSNVYIGAAVYTDTLLAALNQSNFSLNNTSVLATLDGMPMNSEEVIYSNQIELKDYTSAYYISGEQNKYLIISQQSKKGAFKLFAICPENKILVNFPYIQGIVFIVAAASVLLIPCYLIYLRKIILVPLSHLLAGMKAVREGNMDTRIDVIGTSEEFQTLNENFNSMIGQIKDLKIEVYEERLSKQKTELEHLQLQVNPHFFMNSLNIIHSLALIKNYKLIQEMVQCLVKYFRYMFRSNITFVRLDEELEHVRNYLRIQQMRLKGLLTYEIDDPESNSAMMIPPLIIQTFIENSLKYALPSEEILDLSVKIQNLFNDSKRYIKVTISDTGPGFKEEILERLRLGQRIIDERGLHVGIWNVQRRLQLLYANGALISFGNRQPKGAQVEITLLIADEE